ncbi:hypothetical protein ACTXT7_004504 [Hymenolepis weldensis]
MLPGESPFIHALESGIHLDSSSKFSEASGETIRAMIALGLRSFEMPRYGYVPNKEIFAIAHPNLGTNMRRRLVPKRHKFKNLFH